MKIVWHCEDRAGPAMAGPAIRAVELCSRLSRRHEVTLVCPGASALRSVPFRTLEHAAGAPLDLSSADALVAQGFGFRLADALRFQGRLLLDLYDPVQLELLSYYGGEAGAQERFHLAYVRRRLRRLIWRADHLVCASQRQRAHWLGWLAAGGRLLPELLEGDPGASRLLGLVPFGIPPPEPATASQSGGPLRALAKEASPLLWWGGLWDWMDAPLAVRAVSRLRRQGAKVALILPAGNRPGAEAMAAEARVVDEARRAGEWGRGVLQLPAWVPYAERGRVLADAALAVTCHRPSLEAELSFRTRLLDCVWAGLPAVATEGDELSAQGGHEGWVRTVPAGDEEALASGLLAMLEPSAHRAACAAARAAASLYSWDRGADELLRLLEGPPAPRPAAGLLPPELSPMPWSQLGRAAASKLWGRLAHRRRGRG